MLPRLQAPNIDNSTDVGFSALGVKGMLSGHGPTNHMDVLLRNGAGSRFRIRGDPRRCGEA